MERYEIREANSKWYIAAADVKYAGAFIKGPYESAFKQGTIRQLRGQKSNKMRTFVLVPEMHRVLKEIDQRSTRRVADEIRAQLQRNYSKTDKYVEEMQGIKTCFQSTINELNEEFEKKTDSLQAQLNLAITNHNNLEFATETLAEKCNVDYERLAGELKEQRDRSQRAHDSVSRNIDIIFKWCHNLQKQFLSYRIKTWFLRKWEGLTKDERESEKEDNER